MQTPIKPQTEMPHSGYVKINGKKGQTIDLPGIFS